MMNIQDLFQQAKKIQEEISKVHQQLEQQEVEASAGGGMVTVKVSGGQLVTSVKIDRTVINPEDAELLEDLVRAAVNEGVRKSKLMLKEEVSKLTGGMPIPGFS